MRHTHGHWLAKKFYFWGNKSLTAVKEIKIKSKIWEMDEFLSEICEAIESVKSGDSMNRFEVDR